MSYLKLDKKLGAHPQHIIERLDPLIPAINYRCERLRNDNGVTALDLTPRELLRDITPAQLEWVRQQGLIE